MRIAVAGGSGLVGRQVFEAARFRHHEVVVLSRSHGVDIQAGSGLRQALRDVDAVIDVLDPGTTDEAPATEFFTRTTDNIARLGVESGVGHLITLSIVGVDEIDQGYYRAKLEQERSAEASPLAHTILRTTEFHEFTAQILGWKRQDGVVQIPIWNVQTVAARTVAEALVELAEAAPKGRAQELAGPDPASLPDLVRQFVTRRGVSVTVVPVADPEMPEDVLLPGAGFRAAGPSFSEWLDTDDALALDLGLTSAPR